MQSISPVFAQAFIDAICFTEKSVQHRLISRAENVDNLLGEPQVPMHELTEFFTHAQQQCANPDIGLLAYHRAHPAHLGVLGYAVMSCPTLQVALSRMAEHHAMIGTGFSMFVDRHPSTLRIAGISTSTHSTPLPRPFIDAVAAITLGLLHWLAPSARIEPIQAEFTYRKPLNTQALEQLFGRNLKFSSDINALTFSRADAELPVATSDPSLHQIHEHYLKQRHSQACTTTTTARVQRAIVQHLNQGKSLCLNDIAQTLAVSANHLTRALDKEGQGFQKQLDFIRQQQSRHWLLNSTLSLKQIAYRMGFKNQSAFNKACERWFAMPPGSFRSTSRSNASCHDD